MGCGWLDWSPDTVLDTPLPIFFLAIEGKVDFITKTSPFGNAKKKAVKVSPKKAAKLKEDRLMFSFMKTEAKQNAAKH